MHLSTATIAALSIAGKHFANFQSIWRQEAPGVWRIVFDRGERVCDCVKP